MATAGTLDLAPSCVALCALTATLAAAIASTNFSADASLFAGLVQLAVLLGTAALLRRFGLPRLAGGIAAVALLTGFSTCAALMSLVLAATALPLADPALARADAIVFGRDVWPHLLSIARASPAAMTWLSVVYDTLLVQPLLLIPALLVAAADTRLSVFLLAWMTALAMTLVTAPFAPAIAAYLHFGIARGSIPGLRLEVAWEHVAILDAVRHGSLRQLGMDTLFGIVTFPSFHAAGAILLGWGFHGVRLLRWPFHALNAALFVSAIFVGGHYLVDLVAGAAIAVGALAIAARIVARRRPHARSPDTSQAA